MQQVTQTTGSANL